MWDTLWSELPDFHYEMTATKKQLAVLFIVMVFGGIAHGADRSSLLEQEIIARIIQVSTQKCDPQTQYHSVAPYGARLASALSTSVEAPLRGLLENKITVCLDRRLYHQNTGKWHELHHNPLYAGYYSRNGHKVLTLWDNGKAGASNIIDAMRLEDNSYQSREAVNGIFEKNLEKTENFSPLFAVTSSPLGKFYQGRSNRLYAHWTPSSDLKEEMDANPSLITPPLKECMKLNNSPICGR